MVPSPLVHVLCSSVFCLVCCSALHNESNSRKNCTFQVGPWIFWSLMNQCFQSIYRPIWRRGHYGTSLYRRHLLRMKSFLVPSHQNLPARLQHFRLRLRWHRVVDYECSAWTYRFPSKITLYFCFEHLAGALRNEPIWHHRITESTLFNWDVGSDKQLVHTHVRAIWKFRPGKYFRVSSTELLCFVGFEHIDKTWHCSERPRCHLNCTRFRRSCSEPLSFRCSRNS